MSYHVEKQCPKCGQMLRVPKNIGGKLMACPACGNKIISDFKFGGVRKQQGLARKIFELPGMMLQRLFNLLR
ncbi:conserved hypothetical protein [Magnetococcus marinus MC-1]|uniref:Uncharacterized protein n=1 Tax=Magnetococcus marinus (strain ATCC BAA-1437 / JCM 17883 / MC-1) TaxID=156889 RepID=A0L761_MAGMM|nr:conserved hypothetical protein [Magnetococcus marinus MC-1]